MFRIAGANGVLALIGVGNTELIDLPDSAFFEAAHLATFSSVLDFHKLNLTLSANYQGHRNYWIAENSKGELGSVWLVNGQVSITLNGDVSLLFSAKNLMNAEYFGAPQGVGVKQGIPGRGREWALGVCWRW